MLNLVGEAELRRGTSLFATVTGLARIAGPAVAGIVIAASGETAVFFIDAVSFGGVIAVLAWLSAKPAPARHADAASGTPGNTPGGTPQARQAAPRPRPQPPGASAGCSTFPLASRPRPRWRCSWAASGSSSR